MAAVRLQSREPAEQQRGRGDHRRNEAAVKFESVTTTAAAPSATSDRNDGSSTHLHNASRERQPLDLGNVRVVGRMRT